MEDKVIVCNINMFDAKQDIVLLSSSGRENLGSVSLADLSKTLFFLSDKYLVNSIHLYGNHNYADKIKSDFYLNYDNKKNIRIEVN